MPLTPEQQAVVAGLLPLVQTLAGRFGRGDDDYLTEAHVALCKAVLAHDPSRLPLRDYVRMRVMNAMQRLRRARVKRREVPLHHADEAFAREDEPEHGFLATLSPLLSRVGALWSEGVSERKTAAETGLPLRTVRRLRGDLSRLAEEALECGAPEQHAINTDDT